MCFSTEMHFFGQLGNNFLISLDFLQMNDVPNGLSNPSTLLILALCGLIQLVIAFSDTFLHFSIIFHFFSLFLARYHLDLFNKKIYKNLFTLDFLGFFSLYHHHHHLSSCCDHLIVHFYHGQNLRSYG